MSLDPDENAVVDAANLLMLPLIGVSVVATETPGKRYLPEISMFEIVLSSELKKISGAEILALPVATLRQRRMSSFLMKVLPKVADASSKYYNRFQIGLNSENAANRRKRNVFVHWIY